MGMRIYVDVLFYQKKNVKVKKQRNKSSPRLTDLTDFRAYLPNLL